MSTPTWRAVIANATARFPSTSNPRGIGAARSSRWAPLSRSTITPRPATIVFSGISRPTVPVATNASYVAPVCSACFSAGAITRANMIGVSSGTTNSRGVRVLSWNRRAARVASGANGFLTARGRGRTASGLMAVTSCLLSDLSSGSLGQACACELQVDVVESRLSAADRARSELGLVDLGHRLRRGAIVEGQGERRADGERVVAGDSSRAQRGQRSRGVAVDAQLHDLVSQAGQQGVGRVERDDLSGVDDRDPVAEPFGLVQVGRREHDRCLVAGGE